MPSYYQGNSPQYLTSGPNSMSGQGGYSLLQPSRYPLPGIGVQGRMQGLGGAVGGLASGTPWGMLLGGGLTLAGLLGSVFGGDPYKKLEASINRRYDLMRRITKTGVGHQRRGTSGRARQSLAGKGLMGSVVSEQVEAGIGADYADVLHRALLGVEGEREATLTELEAGRAGYELQPRTALAGLMGPGLQALLYSLEQGGS